MGCPSILSWSSLSPRIPEKHRPTTPDSSPNHPCHDKRISLGVFSGMWDCHVSTKWGITVECQTLQQRIQRSLFLDCISAKWLRTLVLQTDLHWGSEHVTSFLAPNAFSNNTTAVFFFERTAFKAVSTSQSSTNPSIPYNKNDQHIFLSASTCSNIPLMASQDIKPWVNSRKTSGLTIWTSSVDKKQSPDKSQLGALPTATADLQHHDLFKHVKCVKALGSTRCLSSKTKTIGHREDCLSPSC